MADLGPRLGIDWGKVRIGVAASNRGTTFAYPVETVPAGDVDRLVELVAEYEPSIIYVGLPLTLRGEHGISADFVVARLADFAPRVGADRIRLVDERLSTAQASRSLGAAGQRIRKQRGVIDQAAAVEILQRAIDVETRTGAPAGRRFGVDEE